MRLNSLSKLVAKIFFLALNLSLLCMKSGAQPPLTVDSFVLLSGANGPGTSIIGSSITINGGTVGAYKLVQTTGNANIFSRILSGDKIIITNSNVLGGNIGAHARTNYPALSPISTGTILSVGSSATITGNIDVNGNVVIGGGTVTGTVTIPVGKTYTGPVPTGDTVFGVPNVPALPALPAEFFINPATYPVITTPITGNLNATPGGNYGNINYSGNKTLTLKEPGTYVFNNITMTGNSNKLVFDFNGKQGVYVVYVRNNADFGKLNASITNNGGGDASRIYFEVQGTGAGTSIPNYSFIIANGSSGGGSKWLGSVYATKAGINVGSGTGSSNVTGTFRSATQINIQSGVTVNYSPFNQCAASTVNAGPDKPLEFNGQTSLTATSNASGVSFAWQALNGGVIESTTNAATITVSAAGTYVVTASAGSCNTTDTVVVSAKVKNIIGSELLSIYENRNSPDLSSSPFFIIQDGYVLIDVIVNPGYYTTVLNLLQTTPYGLIPPYGLNYFPNGQSGFIITGLFPIINLPKINLLTTEINFCRTHYQAFSNSGIITSEGDTTMRSYLVRSGYNIDGAGIKIGVISDSYNTILAGTTATLPLQPVKIPPFIISPQTLDTIGTLNPVPQTFNTNTAAQDIANGDLPNVNVLLDFPVTRTDEGRAMLQIIHDVAPGADLYFRSGFFTANDFALAIKQLRDVGCDIIVDDVTYITEPFLKDGVVAKTVDTVTGQGVSYFTAAGNFANRSYEKNFNGFDITSLGFPGKKAHNFGGGDLFQHVRMAPGNYTFVFQWVDDIFSTGETGGTNNDLDIFLTPNADGSALIGYNRDNTDGDPIEFIPITIGGTDSVDYNIFIVNNTLTSDPSRIKLVVFRGGIRFMEFHEGTSTLVGQGNSAGAFAIGAARFNHVPGHPLLPATLSSITEPKIESFSSIGGTQVNGIVREKPDLTGPDGVNTTVRMGQDYPDWVLNGFSNFFGTSAAAPAAAAAGALIMEGRKKFLAGHPDTSPDELKALMKLTAVDMEVANNLPATKFDYKSGYGLVNADSAMRTFAAPTPFQIQLVVPPNVIPGETQFQLIVTGQNFSNNTTIYMDDSAIQTQFIDKNTLSATIGQFQNNPEITAFTEPLTNFGDGGFSNSLFFYDADIVVQAVNITKKYGQTLPALDTIITINGKLIQDTALTLADIGLASLTVQTTANTNSNVGTYVIDVNRIFDPNNPADLEFLKKYNYTFIDGSVTIEKLPLTIEAQDLTVPEGIQVPNISFTYSFDPAGIANPNTLLNSIQTSHQSQIAKDANGHDIFGLVNGQAVTIFNGQAIPIFNGQQVFFVNGQALTIFNGETLPVINAQALTIFNGVVTDTSGINLTSSQTENLNYQATTNTLQTTRQITDQVVVNGTYVPSTTQVVDIAQESILDFEVNAAQTQMLSSVSNVVARGMVDNTSYANGQALTIFNGQAITIFNGQAVTIFNGQAVTIFNGQAVTIFNGQPVPIITSSNRSGVILNSTEVGQGIAQLKSLNVLTGLTVGQHFILPGTFNNGNYAITYVPGTLTVTPPPPCGGFFTVTSSKSYQSNTKKTTYLFTINRTGGQNALSHWGFPIDLCAGTNVTIGQFLNGAVAQTSLNQVSWVNVPISYGPDPSTALTCTSGDVLKFEAAMNQETTRYFRLIVNGNYTAIPATAYIKYGQSCCNLNVNPGACLNCLTPTCNNNASGITAVNSAPTMEETAALLLGPETRINPNPASGHVTVSFVPLASGRSQIELYSIHGHKVMEVDNGICEAGTRYQKQIDINKLPAGVYLVRLRNGNSVTNQKFVIAR